MPGRPVSRIVFVLICCLALVATLVGCRASSTTPETPVAETPTIEPEVPEPTTARLDMMVFFVSSEQEKVFPVHRTIEVTVAAGEPAPTVQDPAALEGVVAALLAGPTPDEVGEGYVTEIPTGTRVNSVTVSDDGIATVDLSSEFASGGGSLSMMARAAQVVFTLTQVDSVERVAFELDGTPLEALGGEGLIVDPPTSRNDYLNVRPLIMITEPLPHDVVTSPLMVRGQSTTFEATFVIEIVDGTGQVVTEQFVSDGGSMGDFDAFNVSVEFAIAPGPCELVAYEMSAKDGSRTNEVRVPLTVK